MFLDGGVLKIYIPSGDLLHSHGIDGPLIDGLPIKNGGSFHGYVQ